MKKQLISRNLGVLLLLALPFWTFAHTDTFDDEASKTIVKEFSIDGDAHIKVANKYGQIEVRHWAQNNVKFEVEIKVDAKKNASAQERLESIDVEFYSEGDHVEAVTKFGSDDKKDSWWSNWWKGNKNVKIRVNYIIHVPHSVMLDISNKYGNVYVPTMNNDLNINLKYGDAEIEDVQGMLHFHLGYGNAQVGSVSELDLDLKYGGFEIISTGDAHIHSNYSKITLSQGQNLDWESKYDDINIGTATSLSNEGKYDNFQIESIGETNVDTKYSHIKISEIHDSFDFDTGYGSITLLRVADDFKEGKINCKYTKIHIEESADIEYFLELQRLDPNLSESFVKEKSIKDNKDRTIEGYTGSKNGGKIYIEAKYGELKIR